MEDAAAPSGLPPGHHPGGLGLTRWDGILMVGGAVLVLLAALTHGLGAGRVLPFAVSGAALAVLAALVGRAVEGLGDRLGFGATGVLQSALGNIPELLFGIFALRAGLVTVVQAALVGSVLANAVLIVPTLTAKLQLPAAAHEHALSNVASVVLLLVFVLAVPSSLRRSASEGSEGSPSGSWPLPVALGVLAATAGAAAVVSDWFVASLQPALAALHLSQAFAGLVIVAIAGNAVENVVGIQLAHRNKMDYALSITLQSPAQIALVIVPSLVLLSGVLGGATLTLVFPPLLVVALAAAAVVAVVVVFDGQSTVVEGACLIGLYIVLAAAFWWG
jgi:Ca2+:H+ antiporter